MKRITILIAFVLMVISSNAQVDLTESEKEILKDRIIEKLDSFQEELKIIGNRKGDRNPNGNSDATCNNAMREAKLLFMGDGEIVATEPNYWGRAGYYHSYENGGSIVERVDMQTSSKSASTKSQLMAEYLKAIYDKVYSRYNKIVIERAGGVRVDNITKLDNGKYIATAHILQKFEGYKDGYLLYKDYTKKEVVIYIEGEEIITPEGRIWSWVILLEDILDEDTW